MSGRRDRRRWRPARPGTRPGILLLLLIRTAAGVRGGRFRASFSWLLGPSVLYLQKGTSHPPPLLVETKLPVCPSFTDHSKTAHHLVGQSYGQGNTQAKTC